MPRIDSRVDYPQTPSKLLGSEPFRFDNGVDDSIEDRSSSTDKVITEHTDGEGHPEIIRARTASDVESRTSLPESSREATSMDGFFTFTWTFPVETVYITGTFDAWKNNVKMERDMDGVF
jgi:hypothetical protein